MKNCHAVQKTILIFLILIMACCFNYAAAAAPSIVPVPASVDELDGSFTVTKGMKIYAPKNMVAVAKQFADVFKGYEFLIVEGDGEEVPGALNIVQEGMLVAVTGEESYMIEIEPELIKITAGAPAGAFYALQTLRQLMPPEAEGGAATDAQIPAIKIMDRPRFRWRGLMLDVSRHFFTVDFIKKYIDTMVMFKLNTLHLHLTDDQGWRIEIKKYPALTQVGAWREKSGIKDDLSLSPTGPAHGGFYTQDEIREIVKYASDRFVTVVPEIDMPGHMQAALASVPGISCSGKRYKVRTQWGVNPEILCAGSDRTIEFVKDVLTEVMALFPGEYIHIGGDEVPKNNWKKCEKCQARIKKEGLSGEEELQGWFMKQAGDFLAAHGRKMIGWDEILEGGLPPGAAVMSWRGTEGGEKAALSGHDVVMSPTSHCYLDYRQSDDNEPSGGFGAVTPLQKVYSFEPVPSSLNREQSVHIMGLQGNLWTEYVSEQSHAEYMTYPRAAAIAEVGWSMRKRMNWDDFSERMKNAYRRFDIIGVNYRAVRDSDDSTSK